MRCYVHKKSYQRPTAYEDLLQKQYEVKIKEKELMEREFKMQKLLKEVNKRSRSRAKKDLVAADKLKQARKKLIRAINTKEKLDKSKKHCGKDKSCKKKKRAKSKKRSKSMKIDGMLHNFFDKFYKMDDNIQKLGKIKRKDFLASLFTRIFLQRSPSPRSDGAAGDCYLMSLQKTPQLWIYHLWPRFYPSYLDLRSQCKNCKCLCMFFLGLLFWIPCFIFIEVCKCFLCCCWHDC